MAPQLPQGSPSPAVSRRTFLAAASAVSASALLASPAPARRRLLSRRDEVVLYSSVDAVYLRPLVEEASRTLGLRVRAAGDTEATKTFGLVQRVLAERDRPRADVWWSNEPFGTITLAREGCLEPYICDEAEASIDGGWPTWLRGRDNLWYGHALRARVIVHHTGRLPADRVPTTLAGLADPRLRGRVGMARWAFGTTRGHVAGLHASLGETGARTILTSLRDHGIRLYDGNMGVVRAAAAGEIDCGLTDTDDVWAGQRSGWPVGAVYLQPGPAQAGEPGSPVCPGSMPIPSSAGLVRGGPNPEAARALLTWILSERVERALMETDSRNIPVRAGVAAALPDEFRPPALTPIDLDAVADAMEPAVRLADEVFAGR